MAPTTPRRCSSIRCAATCTSSSRAATAPRRCSAPQRRCPLHRPARWTRLRRCTGSSPLSGDKKATGATSARPVTRSPFGPTTPPTCSAVPPDPPSRRRWPPPAACRWPPSRRAKHWLCGGWPRLLHRQRRSRLADSFLRPSLSHPYPPLSGKIRSPKDSLGSSDTGHLWVPCYSPTRRRHADQHGRVSDWKKFRDSTPIAADCQAPGARMRAKGDSSHMATEKKDEVRSVGKGGNGASGSHSEREAALEAVTSNIEKAVRHRRHHAPR